MGKPFFYNNKTKIGQFLIPEEFSTAALQLEEEKYKRNQTDKMEISMSCPEIFDLSNSDTPEVEVEVGISCSQKSSQSSSRKKRKELKEEEVKKEVNEEVNEELKEEINAVDDTCGRKYPVKSDNCIDSNIIIEGSAVERDINKDNDEDRESTIEREVLNDEKHEKENTAVREILTVTSVISGGEPMIDKTQIDSQTGNIDSYPESNDVTEIVDGTSDDSNTGTNTWACVGCTYTNSSELYLCEMCGTASGHSKLRRSQRDGPSGGRDGSIMHSFSLTQAQTQTQTQSQAMSEQSQSNFDSNESTGVRLANYPSTQRRMSSSTTVVNYGASKSQSNKRRR